MVSMAKEMNASSWEADVEKAKGPVVVDFWQPECIWCERLAPVYDEVAGDYDKAGLLSMNIRAEEGNNDLARGFGIMGTPTMKVFCGGRIVGEIVGFRDQDGLRRELDHIIADSGDCLAQTSEL